MINLINAHQAPEDVERSPQDYALNLLTSICQATSVQCGITAMMLLIYEGLGLSKTQAMT